jgi:hypothetical protein
MCTAHVYDACEDAGTRNSLKKTSKSTHGLGSFLAHELCDLSRAIQVSAIYNKITLRRKQGNERVFRDF